jgi:poly(A) polymerase
MQPHAYSPEWSDGAIRRMCMRLGDRLEDAIELARADAAGHTLSGRSANEPKFDALARRIEEVGRDGVSELKSPLTGDQLMARYGRPPGPWIKTVKSALLDEVIDGRLAPDDVEGAWRLADSLAAAT